MFLSIITALYTAALIVITILTILLVMVAPPGIERVLKVSQVVYILGYRALASMTWVTCSGRQTMILKHMQIIYHPQSASIPYKAWV